MIFSNDYPKTQTDAIDYQRHFAPFVIEAKKSIVIKTIAGVDVAYSSNLAFSCVCVLNYATLEVIEIQTAISEIAFPYRTGLLSFREVPPILKAIEKLSLLPDCIVCDGQGIAHPRRFGLACHLGIALEIPTIGCAKTRLYGHAKQPGIERGQYSMLTMKDHVLGCLLRTRAKVKPLYLSIGHKISLKQAMEVILHLTPKYRLPVTTRLADTKVAQLKLQHKLW
jgi:deoxyribonuclease V